MSGSAKARLRDGWPGGGSMEDYVRTYGYLGILLWSFWGGEECVIVSGLLASKGYLRLPGVILAAALGGALGDQIYFYLGGKTVPRLLRRSQRLRRAYPRAERLVQKHGAAIVLVSRFLAGLRITIPIACATFQMSAVKYSLLNLLSAFLWATLFGMVAYYSGRALQYVFSSPRAWLSALALLTGGLLLLRWVRSQRRPPNHSRDLS